LIVVWILTLIVMGEQPTFEVAAFDTQDQCVAARAEAIRVNGPPPPGIGMSECVPVKVTLKPNA